MANEIQADPLTLVSSEPEVRRGPKTELSDAQLHDMKYRLIQFFENYWGEIGYKLPKCRNSEDIAVLFIRLLSKPHDTSIRYVLTSVSRKTTTVAPDKSLLRKVRAELRKAITQRYEAYNLLENAQTSMQNTAFALRVANKNEYRLVKAERKNRRKEYAKAAEVYTTARLEERALTEQLQNLQPSFAVTELLKFLHRRRYEFTPANLGAAMAGFPDIGWRQSMLRCRRTESSVQDSEIYQIFKAIRYLVKTAPDKVSKHGLSGHFKSNIRTLPHRHRVAQEKLADHWRYVEIAIKQLPRVPLHPKEIPFKITENYIRQFETYSPVNAALARQARILLPKRTRRKST